MTSPKEPSAEAIPKPVGREGSEYTEGCGCGCADREVKRLAAALDAALVEVAKSERALLNVAGEKNVIAQKLDAALRGRDEYQKAYDDSRRENDRCYAKMSDEGFQIADLQRRLDLAVLDMEHIATFAAECERTFNSNMEARTIRDIADAFLAANRGEGK